MTKKTTKIDTNSSDSKNTGFKDKRSPEKLAQDQIKLERERIGLIKDQVELAKKQEELKFKELLNKERERREKEAKSFGHRLDALSKAFHNSMTGRTLSATRDNAKFMTSGVKQAYSGYGQAVHGIEDTVKNVVSGLSGPFNAKVTTNGVLANTLVSALTGGVLNPVVMQAMGLNKLASSMFGAGKGVVKTGAGLIKGTAGAVKAGLGGIGTGLGILGTPFALAGDGIGKLFGLNNNDDTSASKTAGKRSNKAYQEAIIQKLDRIDKNTTKTDEKKEDKGNSIIQTMLKAAVGLAMAFAAVKTGLLDFLGEKIGEGANRIGQFFGIEGGAEVAGNFIKDAIPGAIIGLPFGLKGALVGGVLSLVGNSVKRFMNMTGDLDGDAKPDSMGLGESVLRGAITGGLAGWTIGSTLKSPVKGVMIGMLLGAVGGVIAKTIAKIKDWWENFSVVDFSKDMAKNAWYALKDMVMGGDAKAEAEREQLNAKRKEKNDQALKQSENAANFFGSHVYAESKNNAGWTINDRQAYAKQLESEGYNDAQIAEKLAATMKAPKEDPQGGGYGNLNDFSTSGSDDGFTWHGRPAVKMDSLGLKGNIVAGVNSEPYIAEGNSNALKVLDDKLSEWGYDIYYTSAMGGHNKGTGHWKGNKVDLQLKKNGRPTHLNGSQLDALGKAGYWGKGTGALGWEPVSGQVGGGHYDLFLGNAGGTILGGETQYASNIGVASKGTPDMSPVSMSTSSSTPSVSQMTSNQLGNIEASTAQTADNTLDIASNDSTPVTTTTAEGSTGSNGSWFDNLFKSNSNQNTQIASNSGGNSGSGGSSDDNSMIYACGDFARTLVLGYPSPSV